MEKRELTKGDVVQIAPGNKSNENFGGCFMVVTEPKDWGAQGYVWPSPPDSVRFNGVAYFRANWEDMEYVGHAPFIVEEEIEE